MKLGKKTTLFFASLALYFFAEIVLGNLFSLALGQKYYEYLFLPLAGGFTSVLSPVFFALIVSLLFDAFAGAYASNRGLAGRYLFVGIVFALLGPLYEWVSTALVKQFSGYTLSQYYVLPAFDGYTSFLAPAYFFVIGLAFTAVCRRLGLLK